MTPRLEHRGEEGHLTIDEVAAWEPTATIRLRRPDGTAHVEHFGGDELRTILDRAAAIWAAPPPAS